MNTVYILDLPKRSMYFDEHDVEQWELFLQGSQKEQLLFSSAVSASTHSFTFHDIRLWTGHVKAVRVDLQKRKIYFVKGFMNDDDFSAYLKDVLQRLILRTDQSRMVFLTTRPTLEKTD